MLTLTRHFHCRRSSQVMCATFVRRRMFYEDEFVRKYLELAKKRFDEIQALRQRQYTELQNRLAPQPAATTSDQQSTSMSASTAGRQQPSKPASASLFNRQNTLLLTGRSKFYTLSHEEHCTGPPTTTSGPTAIVSGVEAAAPKYASLTRGRDKASRVDRYGTPGSSATLPSSSSYPLLSSLQSNAIDDAQSCMSSTSSSGVSLKKKISRVVGKNTKTKKAKSGGGGSISGSSSISSAVSNGVVQRNGSLLCVSRDKNNNKDDDVSRTNGTAGDRYQTLNDDSGSGDRNDRPAVCTHAGLSNGENTCSRCYNTKCYEQVIGRPTTSTRL